MKVGWRAATVPAALGTATLVIAGALLALGVPLARPFYGLVASDAPTQLGLVAALLALVAGTVATSALLRRMKIERHESIAAAMLAMSAVLFAAYLTFVMTFWPAFAANRLDFGFDLRSLGARVAVAPAALFFIVALVCARAMMRASIDDDAAGEVTRRRFLLAFRLLTALTVVLGIAATLRRSAHPSGYLGELERVVVGTGETRRVDDLCIFVVDEPIVAKACDGKPCVPKAKRLAYLGDDPKKIYFDRERRIAVPREHFEPLTEDTERSVSVVLAPSNDAPCPPKGRIALAPDMTLLHDAQRHIWFRPSEWRSAEHGYVSPLDTARDIATLREVHAPPPHAVVYTGWLAAIAAIVVTLESARRRSRGALVLGTAIVGVLVLPLVIAALAGLVF